MDERRQHVRIRTPVMIEFPHPVTWKTERSYSSDISETGLRFPTLVKLEIGQELALRLGLPFQQATFNATGEVVWIRAIARFGLTQYEVGVHFKWLQDPDRQRLVRHLEAFSAFRV